LQDGLNRSIEWPGKWEMLLNSGKGKRLHTRHGTKDVQCPMGGILLRSTYENTT